MRSISARFRWHYDDSIYFSSPYDYAPITDRLSWASPLGTGEWDNAIIVSLIEILNSKGINIGSTESGAGTIGITARCFPTVCRRRPTFLLPYPSCHPAIAPYEKSESIWSGISLLHSSSA
jgi:hypothetical protein